jgi:hypothetical protein
MWVWAVFSGFHRLPCVSPDSRFKQPRQIRPGPSSGAGSALISFPLGKPEGVERQAALHLSSRLAAWRPDTCRTLATQRSIAALPAIFGIASAPGRVSLGRGLRHPVPVQRAPRRAVLVPPDTMPGAARDWGYEPQARVSASDPAEMTSHDNALGWIEPI